MAVELNVRSNLQKLVDEMSTLTKKAAGVGDSLKSAAQGVSESLKSQTKETESFLEGLRGFSGRVANQMRGDFNAVLSLNAIGQSLKLSEQFRGSIKEAFDLTDTIRKLGPTLGIVGGEFANFQTKMMKGLGDIGLSSTAASNALTGLSQTPVRGEGNLISYAQTAGELASVSREQGREGDIAKGLSGALVAQGANPNDLSKMQGLADDVLRIRNATGKTATEALDTLTQIFSKANKDFLPALQKGGGVSIAAAGLLGGADATGFIEKYLSMNRIERMGLEAQGFKGIVGGNGELDSKRIQAIMGEAKGRGLGDAQAGLATFGLGAEEAKGFIRLAEALKNNEGAVEGARKQIVDLGKTYRETMGFGEAFRANINRVKGLLGGFFSEIGNRGANLLEKASESNAGALGVVGGAGILSALLAGFGLKGVGAALGRGAAAAAGGAAAGGETAIAGEAGLGLMTALGGGAGAGAGVGGIAILPLAAAAVVGGGIGLAGGASFNYAREKYNIATTPSKSLDKLNQESMERLSDSFDKLASSPAMTGRQKIDVLIDNRSKDVKATRAPQRGASFGP